MKTGSAYDRDQSDDYRLIGDKERDARHSNKSNPQNGGIT
jgi:hypothetical protein